MKVKRCCVADKLEHQAFLPTDSGPTFVKRDISY